jgi:NitT/TauT family transport system ATP-binding protein
MNAPVVAATEMIRVERLSKHFGEAGKGFTALSDISLAVRSGEFTTIVGPSGCGKSTMLQIIAGLVPPSSGEVRIDGRAISGPSPDIIGMMFQDAWLLPWKTARENVEFPLALRAVPVRERRERAMQLLELVGLASAADSYPDQLSGGMRQRVAMARTLASKPKILLMDEPFAALDEQTRLLLGDKVLQIQQELKQTTLLITHNITEAVQLADRILVMTYRPGRVKRMVEINLPRPRSSEIVSSEAFGRYVAQIWSDLREEASRGMVEDETRKLHDTQEQRS